MRTSPFLMLGRERIVSFTLAGVLLLIASGCSPTNQLMRANEMATIMNLRAIHQAETLFYSQYGKYAASLTELGSSIPADLATGEKQGYRITLQGSASGYSVTAVPSGFGSTGSRTFFSDQSLVIRENRGPEAATASSPDVEKGTR